MALSGLVPSLVIGNALVASSVETPELPSEHENVTVTSWPVFVPGAYGVVPPPDEGIVAVVVIDGAIESIHTCLVFADSTLFARSEAKYEIVVFPWAVTVTDRDAPGTTVSDVVCAPVEENEMSFTPDVSSAADSAIATDLSPKRRTCTARRRRLRPRSSWERWCPAGTCSRPRGSLPARRGS